MSQPPVGIDLGTTYSSLAIINEAGRPEIVPNQEGERVTASAILFEQDSSATVGQIAVDEAPGSVGRVARWIKAQMGTPDWSFPVDDRAYGAVELSAMILRKLKQDAEATLGPIKHAVITVPASFDEIRRRATIEAGKLAGLEVLRIINEPTAAAIAYASSGGKPGTFLFYDFGGGTFDASIVNIKGELEAEVVASDGDHILGGRLLDEELARHYNGELLKAKNVKISEDTGDWQGLLNNCERDKRTLSGRPEVKDKLVQWKAHTVNVSVSRQCFEQLISDYILKTQMLVENVLSQAKLKPKDIDGVVLVGGSTRIPAVQAMLKKMFGQEPIKSINPDEAVALGAAIQAGAIMQEQGLTELPVAAADRMSRVRSHDVTPCTFGTLAMHTHEGFNVSDERNTVLIEKNRPLPATKTEIFVTMSENQEAIDCSITQDGLDREEAAFVKKIPIEDTYMELPPGLPVNSPIEVTYTYNENGTMECVFKELSSGRSKTFSLDRKTLGIRSESDEIDFGDLVIE